MKILICLLFLTTIYEINTYNFENLLYLEKDVTGLLKPTAILGDETYCYKFTWLGKDYDNETFQQYVNMTCEEKYQREKIMPFCVDPMVATYNGSAPDLTYLLDNHFDAVTCKLTSGNVCAKFSYFFDGAVQNITRLCTKVTVDEAKMTSGCIEQSNGAHTTEVCVCESQIGGMPCNSAMENYLSPFFFITFTALSYVVPTYLT